ncbi:MAG: hypothetical protein AAFR90_09550 [Pseudomonadota bacterium]
MSVVKSYPLAPDYKLSVGAFCEVSASIISRVEEIWAIEKQHRGSQLTNGQIYTLSEFRSDYLLIQPSEYRYVLARRRTPDLQKEGLNIRPLAVSGILLCTDGLVLGQRGSSVSEDIGLWEPAPAGSLSRPDPKEQVSEELREELGIPEAEIKSARVCGLIEDVDSGVFDIVFRLETDATGREVCAAHAEWGSDEYAKLAIVKISELPEFLDVNSNDLLPALRPMLHAASIL